MEPGGISCDGSEHDGAGHYQYGALYIIMRKINGINSHWAMMLLLACQCLPFSVFLYEGFIRSMNQSVEEAAVIDGCTKFSAFWRVTFPLLKPITATVVIMQGVGIWNNYAQAVFFCRIKLPYAPFGDFHVFSNLRRGL